MASPYLYRRFSTRIWERHPAEDKAYTGTVIAMVDTTASSNH